MADPKNWKCLLFGLLLVLMMRFRPQGLLPARETQKTREAR
jgi:ABC-type branched-subunit amino acid transport system permease subunit